MTDTIDSGLAATRVLQVLTERFGHGEFSEGQREAIDAALAGSDLVAVMPTGSGK